LSKASIRARIFRLVLVPETQVDVAAARNPKSKVYDHGIRYAKKSQGE
jgi:hypothetical protein